MFYFCFKTKVILLNLIISYFYKLYKYLFNNKMDLDIQEEIDGLMSIEDILSKQLNHVFTKMWKYPSTEYIVVYHPENINLFKINTFNNLLQYLNVNAVTKESYLEPAIVMACMGSSMGAIAYDRKYPTELRSHEFLLFDKISLNKYQDWYIKDKIVYNKLRSLVDMNLPNTDRLNPFQIPHFEDLTIHRHPQLRRILKEYFLLIDQKFNDDLLCKKLDILDVKNINYSFLDYDELFLLDYNWYQGTRFENIPMEIKKIIINYIDNDHYLLPEVIFMKTEPIVKTIENIIDIVVETENASVIDIYEKAYNQGYLDDFFKHIKDDPDINGNIYKYITSNVGINNIKDIIDEKIKNDKFNKY